MLILSVTADAHLKCTANTNLKCSAHAHLKCKGESPCLPRCGSPPRRASFSPTPCCYRRHDPRASPPASRLHLGCISAASRLHLGCISQEYFGEISFFYGERRSASASSVQYTHTMELGRGALSKARCGRDAAEMRPRYGRDTVKHRATGRCRTDVRTPSNLLSNCAFGR